MTGTAHGGKGFGGLCRYLLHGKKDNPKPDRVAWTSTRELALEDPKDAALLMRRTAALGRTEKPLEHLSFSLAPGEHLSREQWEVLIDRTLKDLGLEGYQVLIVAHRDTKCEHVHLMINRVHPETYRAWDRWRDQNRVMDSMRLREPEFGLRVNLHVKDPDRLPERAVKAFIHAGEPPLLDFARAEARPIFKEARSWEELHERLAEVGLYLERKGQGLVLTDERRYVKASSVDRGASLKALQERLGPYEQRRPLLQEVDRDLRSGRREAEIHDEIRPSLDAASSELNYGFMQRYEAARDLKSAQGRIDSAIRSTYRDPANVASRYFRYLDERKALPSLHPVQLGELKGTVLRAGRYYLPLGAEATRALHVAENELPQLGAAYLRAQEDLSRAEARITKARDTNAQLQQRFRPQIEEWGQIEERAKHLPERLMSLRPRDQIALVRTHGRRALVRGVEGSPERATRTVASRQRWMQNLSPHLNRVLDGRLSRTGLSLPTPRESLLEWTAQALRHGLHPLHAVQMLTRGGVPLADAAQAVSLARSVIRDPAKAALWLTAKALGIPSLPVRLATWAFHLVRDVGQVLSR